MTAVTTAADYAWLDVEYPALMEAYCLTLVRDITPERLLQELGAEPRTRITGVDGLCEPSYESWDGHDGERLFVGVTAVGGWTLMVEYNGYLGIRHAAMIPVSRGRRVVSHFRNVNAVDHFYWFEDGDVRLHFEPLFACARDGSHADGLLTEMRESGFDLSDGDDRDYSEHTEAAFALAHRLTGIRLTPQLLASAEFLCGVAPVPER
ncbi:DUF6461 domain-containing protein [Streptomyces sp. S.PNR 29]|uniref:DUF6461 domain-containing protein n=1 Tax=Streptomyces sp. S.PNR 29 TaxID=2973805 RepID=UPI0025AF922A|nr:DUF6461 domain-containing protein [Streptomyces sp. S.PNR 29]MDN0196105.1 DUF6461 domain-containing protein [Streptomyces sp. S.PNR 29]